MRCSNASSWLSRACSSRALARVSLLALGLLAACGGRQLGGNPDAGDFTGPDGATCVEIDPSTYDQSCTSDSDCILIKSGDVCSRDCLCGDSPVSASEMSRYESALSVLPPPSLGCACGDFGGAQCIHGECTLCGPGSTNAGCYDGDGGTVTTSDASIGDDGGPSADGACVPTFGPSPGTIPGVPASCPGDVYFQVPASSCPFLSCCSSVVYALCEDGTYSECDCDIPSGFSKAP
jgi:hypothetical protein